jgi:hypothetical protein
VPIPSACASRSACGGLDPPHRLVVQAERVEGLAHPYLAYTTVWTASRRQAETGESTEVPVTADPVVDSMAVWFLVADRHHAAERNALREKRRAAGQWQNSPRDEQVAW